MFAAQHGPGIENAFAGVAQAYSENVPLLVIPGGFSAERQYIRPTFRAAEVFRPVTKWSALVTTAKEIPDVMRRAYQAMRSGKPGPVLVEVQTDVFEEEFDGAIDYQPVPVLRSAPDPEAVKEAARLLLAAKNPLLWAGQGVHYAEAGDWLAALAELVPAPVAATNPGKSAIPDTHPLSLGGATRSRSKAFAAFMGRADLVLAIGSSLTKTAFGPAVPAGKTVIHSTNDAFRHQQGLSLRRGARGRRGARHRSTHRGGGTPAEIRRLPARCRRSRTRSPTIKTAWFAEWSKHFESDETPINQYRVIGDLMKTVDRDNVIITHDSGSPREQLLPFWQTTKAASYMGWGKSTQLGYGLGLAMGAKLAAPDKLCINVMGDCSFGMTGMDMETASRNRIGIFTVVFNNQVMACEREVMKVSTARFNSLSVGGNYAKMAEGLNVAARRVEKAADIIPAIKEAIDTTEQGAPYLMEIVAKEGYDFSRY